MDIGNFIDFFRFFISIHTNRFMKLGAKNIIGIVIFCLMFLAIVTNFGKSNAEEDADSIRRQALELREKARRADCKKIAMRIVACYESGDCSKMHDSIAWFTNEYGESPELSCPSRHTTLFGEGGGA